MTQLHERLPEWGRKVFNVLDNIKFPAALAVIGFLLFKNNEINKAHSATNVEKTVISSELEQKIKEVQNMSLNLVNYQKKLQQKEKMLREYAKKNEEIKIEMEKLALMKADPKAREAQLKILKERENQLKSLEKEMKAKDDELEDLQRNMQNLFVENDKLRKENNQLKAEQNANVDTRIADLQRNLNQKDQELANLNQKVARYEGRPRVQEVRLLTYSNGHNDSKEDRKLEQTYKATKVKEARVFIRLDRKLYDNEVLEVEISNHSYRITKPVNKKNYSPYDELFIDFVIPKNSLKTGDFYAKVILNGNAIGYDKVILTEGS